jgi:hypothetical protein
MVINLFREDGRDATSKDSCFEHRICVHRGSNPHVLSLCHVVAFVSIY